MKNKSAFLCLGACVCLSLSASPSVLAQNNQGANGYLSSNYEALSPKPNMGVMPAAQNDLNKTEKKEATPGITNSVNENNAARGKLSHHPTEPLLTPMELDSILEKYQVVGKKFNPNCDLAAQSSGKEICMKELESYFENKNVRLRVLKPNSMTTMEYSMNRISFHLNDKDIIISVQVG